MRRETPTPRRFEGLALATCGEKSRAMGSHALRPAAGAHARSAVPRHRRIVAALVAIVASMFYFDATASDWARQRAAVVARCVRADHQFRPLAAGSSYPFGFIILCLAAVMSPELSRRSREAAQYARGALWFFVPCDRRAGPVRHHRQAPDRPGAALCRRLSTIRSPICRSSGDPNTPACRRAMPPPRWLQRSRSARSGRARAVSCGSMRW